MPSTVVFVVNDNRRLPANQKEMIIHGENHENNFIRYSLINYLLQGEYYEKK